MKCVKWLLKEKKLVLSFKLRVPHLTQYKSSTSNIAVLYYINSETHNFLKDWNTGSKYWV